MSSLPAWAIWSIAVPCALLSPVLAFFLAIAVEIAIGSLVDAGPPALLAVGIAASALFLFRKRAAQRGPSPRRL